MSECNFNPLVLVWTLLGFVALLSLIFEDIDAKEVIIIIIIIIGLGLALAQAQDKFDRQAMPVQIYQLNSGSGLLKPAYKL